MRSRRTIKREPGANDHDDNSTASELLVLQTSHDELFRDDSELLLSATSRFLCDDTVSSSAFAFPPINDFPSFQALLQAATTVVAANDAEASQPAGTVTARVSTRTQKRRERNRISCRKTRLKRKVEQASEDLLAAKRAEHNQFLSELHHDLTQQQHGLRELENEQASCELIVRSLHFQLMDPEYDASWCFELDDGDRRARGRNASDADQVLLDQWQAIVAELENASLDILQVYAQQKIKDGSQSQCVRCQWRLVGLSKQQLQNGRAEKVMVSGVTSVRFNGQSIESIDMHVI